MKRSSPAPMRNETFTLVGIGRNRTVFRRGNVVLKVPHNDMGFHDNYSECRTFRGTKGKSGDVRYARCRLLKDGCLLMVHVEELYGAGIPDWADWIDCRQVGIDRKGRVLAYDYA